MSTRGAIGMRQPDGTVRAVYVHHDAYVAGVGAILGGWYETPELVKELLDLGDLSSLGTTLADTVAYHRDRGERMKSARRYADIDAYRRNGRRDLGADYLYLYDGGRWMAYGIPGELDWIHVNVSVVVRENMSLICHRCKKVTDGCLTMSWFNTELICVECSREEKLHKDFKLAYMAVNDALSNGICNFPGIGLPDDLEKKE